MTKKICLVLVLFLFAIPMGLPAQVQQQITVTSEADQYAKAGKPVQATITVTHEKDQKIDENSFKLGGEPIQPEFIKNVSFSKRSELILSIYHFTIPPQEEGLQYLPPVSVIIDGKEYTSDESAYQVGK